MPRAKRTKGEDGGGGEASTSGARAPHRPVKLEPAFVSLAERLQLSKSGKAARKAARKAEEDGGALNLGVAARGAEAATRAAILVEDDEEIDVKPIPAKPETTPTKPKPTPTKPSRATRSPASAKKKKVAFVLDDDEDEGLTREEEEAEKHGLRIDRAQYYPIALPITKPTPSAPAEDPPSHDMVGPIDTDKDAADPDAGFVFLQLPCELPEVLLALQARGGGSKEPVGKLITYTDGSQELRLGDVTMDIFPGTPSWCRHEVAMLSTVSDECCFLGKVSDKKVLIPKV